MQQQTLAGDDPATDWYTSHERDYAAVRDRLARTREVTLTGDISAAAENLKKSYVFAVLSVQTRRDRHERAFTRWCAGDVDVREAAAETNYGNQKGEWITETLDSTDWHAVARAVRAHVRAGRREALLDMEDNFVGVSHVKWAFTLAMVGVWEVCCIDTNVQQYLGIDGRLNVPNADEYVALVDRVRDAIDAPVSPFEAQWAIYDMQRGEHSRHMVFFREISMAPPRISGRNVH